MKRNYLHPVRKQPKFRTSDFQKMQEGKTLDGTRITQFEAINPAINHGYKHGIQVQAPGQAPVLVFGSYEEIRSIGDQIKTDVNQVMKTLRPVGQSQFYTLNDLPQTETHSMPDPERVENYKRAKAIYPTHGRDNQVLSDEQIEMRAAKEHMREMAEKRVPFPSSTDGAAKVEEMVNPKPQGTILSEAE